MILTKQYKSQHKPYSNRSKRLLIRFDSSFRRIAAPRYTYREHAVEPKGVTTFAVSCTLRCSGHRRSGGDERQQHAGRLQDGRQLPVVSRLHHPVQRLSERARPAAGGRCQCRRRERGDRHGDGGGERRRRPLQPRVLRRGVPLRRVQVGGSFFLFLFSKTFIYIILHFITFILTKHKCSIHNERHKPLSNTKIHN